MTTNRRLILIRGAIALVGSVAACLPQSAEQVQGAHDAWSRLAGTWRYETGDLTTFQRIVLILRDDGSYTKSLEARVNGVQYGGTHNGSWTARGMVVRISGDNKWPAFTHDLSDFRRD